MNGHYIGGGTRPDGPSLSWTTFPDYYVSMDYMC